jgi:hypothetical protein
MHYAPTPIPKWSLTQPQCAPLKDQEEIAFMFLIYAVGFVWFSCNYSFHSGSGGFHRSCIA